MGRAGAQTLCRQGFRHKRLLHNEFCESQALCVPCEVARGEGGGGQSILTLGTRCTTYQLAPPPEPDTGFSGVFSLPRLPVVSLPAPHSIARRACISLNLPAKLPSDE